MRMFEVKVKLANLAVPSRTEEVSLLVDTGATLSWVPRQLLEKLGVKPTAKLEFQLADGRLLQRDAGAALFTIDGDGKSLGIPIAFGGPGEESVLGATALEALGFMVDPVEKKLIPRNLRMLRVGTNEPFTAYQFMEGLSVLALGRIEAEGVRKCFS